ncbi:hypothetical protein EJB05_09317, partial [Eragrostis curvula]
MALLENTGFRAMFLVAIMVHAMVLASYPAQGLNVNCVDLNGIVCNQDTCSKACKGLGYVDPIAQCKTRSACCCLVKCCGRKMA